MRPDKFQSFTKRSKRNSPPSAALGDFGSQERQRREHGEPRDRVHHITSGGAEQSQDQTGERGPGDIRHVALSALQGQRLRERFARHQVRDYGLARRLFQRGEKSEQHRGDIEHLRRRFSREGQQREARRHTGQAYLRAHHELAAVHRIRQKSGDEQKNNLRNSARQPEETDLKRRIGELINLPRHGDGGELAADAGEKAARPKQPKVPLTKRLPKIRIMSHFSRSRCSQMNDYLPINFFIRSTTSLGCDTASLANASSSCPVVGLISRGVCFASMSRAGSFMALLYASRKILGRSAGMPGGPAKGRPNSLDARTSFTKLRDEAGYSDELPYVPHELLQPVRDR